MIVSLAAFASLAGSLSFAQTSGETVYKAKCQSCHGPAGMADSNVGKILKVKPVTDPTVKKMGLAEMIQDTRSGTGKMQAFKDKLSDAEIKASVDYFRSLIK
jgi:mono/diheme cytochrome c family protein